MHLHFGVAQPTGLMRAHYGLGEVLSYLGDLTAAREQLEHAWRLYNAPEHNSGGLPTGDEMGVSLLSRLALTLRLLGHADQSRQRIKECLALAKRQGRPFELAFVLTVSGWIHAARREWRKVRERSAQVMRLSTKQGFPYFVAYGTAMEGWALAEQGQVEEGIARMQQGLASFETVGAALGRLDHLPRLAAAYAKAGRIEEGLTVLTEALSLVEKTGARSGEAELYRLKGELTLQRGPATGCHAIGSR